jgi:hypothetical protein
MRKRGAWGGPAEREAKVVAVGGWAAVAVARAEGVQVIETRLAGRVVQVRAPGRWCGSIALSRLGI